MNLKKWKGIYEQICWDRALVLTKKNLPGRGLTKVEKHWFRLLMGVTLIKITKSVQFVAHAFGNQQQEQLVIKCSVLLLTKPTTAKTTFL